MALAVTLLGACQVGVVPTPTPDPTPAPTPDPPPPPPPDPCAPPLGNPVKCENALPGSPSAEWGVSSGDDPSLVGFATDMSVQRGQQVRFKIRSTAAAYDVDIYRLGYYGGAGARHVASVAPSAPLPQAQPECLDDPATGLVDCGNWAVSATWDVPATAVSGVYIARLERPDTGGRSHIVFVVRDDASRSDLYYQTSDTTWQAYNSFGGNSLYTGAPAGRAYKVSYNRPFSTRSTSIDGRDYLFGAEYPMIRWLEANGYDISYGSGIDSDRYGSLIENHRAFLSVGHDEYWSAAQRANVEAARDAGVHLAFFSGNTIFWKTRWESSIDGSGTPYRTLVSYKETKANGKIDPDPQWTGTWRDPRFSPPSDGGRPENALLGSLFVANCCTSAIDVPADDGRMRLWRDTPLAAQAPGTVTTLADGTLGYEWDTDVDNGYRPAGLARLSTSVRDVPQSLVDWGSTVVPATATHHITQYRAPSGALVFAAGTIQWSYGLDPNHDGPSTPVDARLQQATVNLLADMGVQPATLQSPLVAATASTDTTPPVSHLTSPTPGAELANGTLVTVTGTATDGGGGRVAGVEISTDGGATWHPAEGRETWSYTWQVSGTGPVNLLTRAVDDSANLESPSAGTTVSVSCPCTAFGEREPANPDTDDATPVELGMRFTVDQPGFITGVRFFKGPGNVGTHTGSLWNLNGFRLATATFGAETPTGWQQVTFGEPVPVVPGTDYVVSYFAPAGHYASDQRGLLLQGVHQPPLRVPIDLPGAANGLYRRGTGFPDATFLSTNYWVDAVFVPSLGPDTTPPTVVGRNPQPGAGSVGLLVSPSVAFDEPIQPTTGSVTLVDGDGAAVAGTVGYDAATRTLRFQPTAPFAPGTAHTVTVTGVQDLAGNAMPGAVTWSFTTVSPSCPCTLFGSEAPAQQSSGDTAAVEVGVRFRADVDGFVSGVRFYKGPTNTGTHVGSLWTDTGTRLAQATFGAETATGWQEVDFAQPVAVTAGTMYVASALMPDGGYAADPGGLATGHDAAPLHAADPRAEGANGVFRYGGGFPSYSFLSTNYWVDVTFLTSLPPDTTPPAVIERQPAPDATGVSPAARPSATFSEPVVAGSVDLVVTGPGGAPVAGTVTYDEADRVATFTPSAPLLEDTAYEATVAHALDTAGNPLGAPVSWSFTTGAVACPCTLFGDAVPAVAATADPAAVEVGVRFTADRPGVVTGVRFYKGPGNTGTHVGSLWDDAGNLLARVTFTDESGTGWQQASFDVGVAVVPGTVYVASVFMPDGHYASQVDGLAGGWPGAPLSAPPGTPGAPNGVYRYGGGFPVDSYRSTNYWVDVVFTLV